MRIVMIITIILLLLGGANAQRTARGTAQRETLRLGMLFPQDGDLDYSGLIPTIEIALETIEADETLPFTFTYTCSVPYAYLCSARMRNPPGCVTGCRLHNRTPSCATGHPDVLPESLSILLLNRVDSPTRLNDSLHHIACFGMCVCLCDSDSQ